MPKMFNNKDLRQMIRLAAVEYQRGEVPGTGMLPSSYFDSLSIRDLEYFGHIVYEAQLLSIEDGFANMKEVELPNLGIFKFKKGWPIYTNLRKAILEENGLTELEFKKLSEDDKLSVLADFEARAHQLFKERLRLSKETNKDNIDKIRKSLGKSL